MGRYASRPWVTSCSLTRRGCSCTLPRCRARGEERRACDVRGATCVPLVAVVVHHRRCELYVRATRAWVRNAKLIHFTVAVINSFILSLGVGNADVYNGVNVIYALFSEAPPSYSAVRLLLLHECADVIIASVCGLYAVYNGAFLSAVSAARICLTLMCGRLCGTVYKGLAVPSPKAKKWGMLVMVVLLVLSFLQIFLAAGNTNGFANLGSDRMVAAEYVDCAP